MWRASGTCEIQSTDSVGLQLYWDPKVFMEKELHIEWNTLLKRVFFSVFSFLNSRLQRGNMTCATSFHHIMRHTSIFSTLCMPQDCLHQSIVLSVWFSNKMGFDLFLMTLKSLFLPIWRFWMQKSAANEGVHEGAGEGKLSALTLRLGISSL